MPNKDYMKELGRTVKNKMNKSISSSMYGTGIVLGTKTEKGVLVDGQTNEYIGEDCFILDHLLLEDKYITNTSNDHLHEIKAPENFRIYKGDRVLVALLGTNCVIVGRVTNG